MDGGSVTDFGDRLANYEREISSRMAQARELGLRLAEIRGVGEAADGLVRVEVSPGGRLTDLRLDPRAMRLGSQTLTEEILAATSQADADAARQVQQETAAGPTTSWEELLAGASADPSAPLPPLPDEATFQRMIRDAPGGGDR
jgi:DNA-binding protein YbaB